MSKSPASIPPRSRIRWIVLAVLLVLVGVGLYPAIRYALAERHRSRAIAAMDRRDFPTARRHLDHCLREWPDSAEVHFLAARAARREGDLDQAERLLKDAQRLGWVTQAIDLERALLRVQHGEMYAVAGYLVACLRRNHPDSLLILEILVPATIREYDLVGARELLDEWIRLEPNNAIPYLKKGDICERMRQRNDALELYQQAVQCDSENYEARLRYASLLLAKSYSEQALPHYEWLLQRTPESLEVTMGLARCKFELGRGEEVRSIVDRLHAQHPDNSDVPTLLGLIALEDNRVDDAERFLRRAHAKDPYATYIIHNLAICCERKGKTDEAAELRKQMTEITKDQEAATVLVRKIAQYPDQPVHRCDLARILLRNGMEQEAKRWLDTALRTDPRFVPALNLSAEYYDKLGDLTRAGEYRKMAIEAGKKKP